MELTTEQRQELKDVQDIRATTRRPVVAELEAAMHTPIPVLDHGFVRVVDYMGDDAAIVQAARISYGKGTKKVSEDRGLIRYLVKNRHTTPLEMCEIKLHVKMPIFVARQWVRHRMASINEVSARYSELDREFYFPDPAVMGLQDTKNRQGRTGEVGDQVATKILGDMRSQCDAAYDRYKVFLDDGLARELARMVLPLNVYTQWYWKIDLHNLLHFLSLRMDSHAQHEIRVFANVIGDLVAKWVPTAWEAFQDFRFQATTLSRQEIEYVRGHLTGAWQLPGAEVTLTPKEQEELMKKLGLSKPGS
jgi:thymidylate synthase (FAD)